MARPHAPAKRAREPAPPAPPGSDSAACRERMRAKVARLSACPLPALAADGFDAIADTITMPDAVVLRDLRHADVNLRDASWSPSLEPHMGTVVPECSRLVTVYVDPHHRLCFYFNDTPCNLYTANFEWAVLGERLPADTVMTGLFYTEQNRQRQLLGLFDLRKLRSEWLHAPLIDRHRRLHELLRADDLPPFVRHHWVGYAAHCRACLRNKLPFKTHCMFVLDAAADQSYLRVLAPLAIPTLPGAGAGAV